MVQQTIFGYEDCSMVSKKLRNESQAEDSQLEKDEDRIHTISNMLNRL